MSDFQKQSFDLVLIALGGEEFYVGEIHLMEVDDDGLPVWDTTLYRKAFEVYVSNLVGPSPDGVVMQLRVGS